MKSQKTRQIQLQLWRTLAASLSMKRVIEHCDYLLENEPHPGSIPYHAAETSLCIEYGRPFSAGTRSRIGAVSSKFESFSDGDLQQLHCGLLDARHNFYAHYTEGAQEIVLEFVHREVNGEDLVDIETYRKDTHVGSEWIPDIRRLAITQQERFRTERNRLLNILSQKRSFTVELLQALSDR